jgi:ATP-dependent phosphofructokinase / diphosphate-dependent phosphofructokinase
MTTRIGILTAGSDCPGLNAAIRAIGKSATGSYGMEIIGFQDGFQGLIDDQPISLEGNALSGILTLGGTILGTSRDVPHAILVDGKVVDKTDSVVATYHKHGLDALVCLGGRETQESALHLMQAGLNVITLPKAIDNDVQMTDFTIGFDTAMSIGAEAIDRLHSTAHSHHRIILVELMGAHAGWLTLGAGISSGADVIIIPEIPYEADKVADKILQRNRVGKRYSIVAVCEGAKSKATAEFFEHSLEVNEKIRSGEEKEKVAGILEKIENQLVGNTLHLANQLGQLTGLDTRITILGHLLRGGTPSAGERLLATRMGTACVQQIKNGNFGVMVSIRGDEIVTVPLSQVGGSHKPVPLDYPWIASARHVGTSLGD